jgi:hypothetical protein
MSIRVNYTQAAGAAFQEYQMQKRLSALSAGPPVMTVAEVAEALQVGHKTAWEMAQGELAHIVIRVGAKKTGIRFLREGFRDWLQNGGRREEANRG